jgi:hypothetical protein
MFYGSAAIIPAGKKLSIGTTVFGDICINSRGVICC